MIDGLQVYFQSRNAYDRLLHDLQGLVFYGKKDTGDVDSYRGNDGDIRITLFATTPPAIKLNGSLHKFALGRNEGRFHLKGIRKSVHVFSEKYHVNPKEENIQKIELGFNIPAISPEAIIRSAVLFRGRPGKIDPHKKYYSKTWEFEHYKIKLYKKGPQKIRFEVSIEVMRQIQDLDLRSLSNITDLGHLISALHYVYTTVNHFLFIPADSKNKLSAAEKTEWDKFRSQSYWEELGKDAKYRKKIKVRRIIKQYDLIDWADYIKRGIISEGSKILEMSEDDLSAKISRLGLQEESVAGPNGSRDRQAGNVFVSYLKFLVPVHSIVRNVGYTVDVIISSTSYKPLFPRGPPSNFSFLLFIYAYSVALLIPVVSRMSLIGMVPVS